VFTQEQRRLLADGSPPVRESLVSTAVELGWFGLSIPEHYGGLGLDLAHCVGLYEEIGAALAPLPIMTCALVAQVILRCASAGQKERYLAALAAGEHVGTLDGGAIPNFRIVNRRGERRLFGQTKTLLDGEGATLFLLRATCEDEQERWVLLDARERRLSGKSAASIDKTRSFGIFAADGLILGDDEVFSMPLTEEDALTSHACIALASDSIGGASAVFEETLEYLKTRRQFDRPVGSFQALKHRCADHRIQIDLSRALLTRAIRHAQEPPVLALAPMVSLAKAICCDAYGRVAADCMQLHGGVGFTWEHPCHLYLRRAKLNQHLFGSSIDCLDRGARALTLPVASGSPS
jgi:alkylation response protein AidB-like acyl-CoA dehydrogenase